MSATTMVHVRVDEQLKAQASEALAQMGLSLSDAVRVFLTRVVAEQQIPFAIKVPNAETLTAMQQADDVIHTRKIRFRRGDELVEELEEKAGGK